MCTNSSPLPNSYTNPHLEVRIPILRHPNGLIVHIDRSLSFSSPSLFPSLPCAWLPLPPKLTSSTASKLPSQSCKQSPTTFLHPPPRSSILSNSLSTLPRYIFSYRTLVASGCSFSFFVGRGEQPGRMRRACASSASYPTCDPHEYQRTHTTGNESGCRASRTSPSDQSLSRVSHHVPGYERND